VAAVAGEDQLKYSVMSYRSYDGQPLTAYAGSYYPTTPMLNDVLAMQMLYGANTSYNTGNNTYSWAASAKVFETIWDAGGTDTLSAASQAQAVALYLTPGKWSQIGVAFFNGQTNVRDNLTIAYGANIENAVGSNFADLIEGNALANSLSGGSGNDTMLGLAGADNLSGDAGNDSLSGGAGSDIFRGGAGNDTMDGGTITDLVNLLDLNSVSYSDSTTGIVMNLQTGVVQDGLGGTDQLSNINFATGSAFSDVMTGSNSLVLFEQFEGGAGNDTLDGGAIDPISALNGARASYLGSTSAVNVNLGTGIAQDGMVGIDTLININQVRGSAFNDTLTGSDTTDYTETLEGRGGNDILDGKGGNDIARYDGATTGVNANLATGVALDGQGGTDTLLNIEGLTGGNSADVLTGGNPANGSGAIDGFEFFTGRGGNDTINGGAGYDRADYYNSTSAVNVTLGGASSGTAQDGMGGVDTLISIEGVRGSEWNDFLTGSNDAFESFEGRGGNDVIDGKGGMDRIDFQGAPGAVQINLGANVVTADGYGGTDTLANIEAVRGTAFADSMVGSAADNVFEGRGGDDTLTGGAGADIFNFAANGNGVDLVTDFALGDSIQVAAVLSSTAPTLGNVSTVSGNGVQLGVASGVTTLFIDTNAAAGAEVQIRLAGTFDPVFFTVKDNLDGTSSIALTSTPVINGTSGDDTLAGTGVSDSIFGLAGNDLLAGGLGDDTLDGGADIDTASYAGATGAVMAFLWNIQATGADGTDSLLNIENLMGSAFNDRLDGTNGANDLKAGDGNDSLFAYAGADTLTGGVGNDLIDGGADTDTASYAGATGAVTAFLWGDQATGADGTDILYNIENLIGSAFNDRLDGTNTANDLNGGAGNDSLYAYAGADTLTGGAGNDLIDGGADTDTVSYAGATGAVTVFLWGSQATGADGTDTLYNFENVIGSAFNDRIDGTNNADGLNGGAGDDSLFGYGGTDTLTGGAGNDLISGGAGNDIIRFAASGNGIDTLTDLAIGDTINIAALLSTSLGSVTNGNGSTVSANSVQVSSASGTTTLYIDTNNSAGAEVQISISGSYSAANFAITANGDSTSNINLQTPQAITGTASAEVLNGTSANDTVLGLAGNDTLSGSTGDDTVDGGADIDTASYAAATAAVTAYLWGNQATGGDGTDALLNIENLIGSAFNDRLDGTNAANDLNGGAGNDSLYAYAGNDTLSGGQGNDLIDGGADTDTASYAGAASAVTVFLWGSQATGGDGTDAVYNFENVIGSAFNDRLDGTNTANDLNGGAGADSVYAYAGDDTLTGGAGNDLLDAGADIDTVSYAGAAGAITVFLWGSQASGADGADTLYNFEKVIGSAFNDRLDGTNSNDGLMGGAGNDSLNGYGGVDTLEGGAGNDVLNGGTGADSYVFASASGLDTIQGFAVAEADKIQLASNLNGSGITTAAQALAATSYASGNAIVDLGAGNSVTLVGVAPGGLSAGDFVVG
jgi:Ca2+-binding RTX toxin-like protein